MRTAAVSMTAGTTSVRASREIELSVFFMIASPIGLGRQPRLPCAIKDQVVGIDATQASSEIPARRGAVCRLVGRCERRGADHWDARGPRAAASSQSAATAGSVALSGINQGDRSDGAARYGSGAGGLSATSPERRAGGAQITVQVAGRSQGAGGCASIP